MIDQLKHLVQLQVIDKTLYELGVEQEEIPQRLAELKMHEDELAQKLALAQDELGVVAARRQDLESEVEKVKSRQRKAESRLMGSKSQKEYRAANAEIDEAKDSIRGSEELLLELMEQNEALDKDVKALQAEYDAAVKEAGEERGRLEKRNQEISDNLQRLETKRGGLTGVVDDDLMRQYDFIRSRRQGVALAPVQQGTCMVCHMQLPPQQFNELQRLEKIMTCPTCSRLIYWADAEPFAEK